MSEVKTTPTVPAYKLLDDTKGAIEVKDIWGGSGKTVFFPSANQVRLKGEIEQVYTIQASQFVAGNITTQNQIQIQVLPKLIPGRYEYAELKFQITETSGVNPVTLAPMPYLFSTSMPAVQTAFNGSGAVSHSIPADALYQQFQYYSPAELTNVSAFNRLNMSATTYVGPTAISAGASVTYVMPLPMLPLVGLWSQTLGNGATIITLNLAGSNCVISGSGTASLTGVQLVLTTHKNDILDASMSAQIMDNIFVKNVVNFLTATMPPTTLTSGTSTQIQLGNIVSNQAAVMLVMLRTTKTTSGAYNFFSLAGSTGNEDQALIDLKTPSGVSVLGSGPVTGLTARTTLQYLEAKGVMSTVVPIYALYMSANPNKFIKDADSQAGLFPMPNNMQLILTPTGNFTSQSYIIDVIVMSLQQLWLSGGVIKLLTVSA